MHDWVEFPIVWPMKVGTNLTWEIFALDGTCFQLPQRKALCPHCCSGAISKLSIPWSHFHVPTNSHAYSTTRFSKLAYCRAPLHEECPKHHGHEGDLGVTPMTCGAVGDKAQVILVWVRAPSVGNTSHPQRLGITRVRPWAMCGLWHADSIMLKNTSIGCVI